MTSVPGKTRFGALVILLTVLFIHDVKAQVAAFAQAESNAATPAAACPYGRPQAEAIADVPAASIPHSQFLGVNLAGLGFGKSTYPGKRSIDYEVPTFEEVAYFAGKGMSLVRIEFRWERLQHHLRGPLDARYLGYIRGLVDDATKRGMVAVIDLHNYARRKTVTQRGVTTDIIGSLALPNDALADVWRRLALEFKGNSRVWFGLMNEPHDIPTRQWLAAANAAAKAIRETKAANKLLVMGSHWGGAIDFVSTDNAAVMAEFQDPGNNFAFEVHQYLDAPPTSFGGPAVKGSGAKVLVEITNWARLKGYELFLGEFAFLETHSDIEEGRALLGHIEANPDVWLGWAWWAAGPWWGDYYYSLTPKDGQDRPQMQVLEPFLARACSGAQPRIVTRRMPPL